MRARQACVQQSLDFCFIHRAISFDIGMPGLTVEIRARGRSALGRLPFSKPASSDFDLDHVRSAPPRPRRRFTPGHNTRTMQVPKIAADSGRRKNTV